MTVLWLQTLFILAVGAPVGGGDDPSVCAAPLDPEYYRIALITTRRVPGSAYARGTAEMVFEESPFAVSLAPDGSYRHELSVRVEGLQPAAEGHYVVWATTPTLDRAVRLGTLGDDFRVSGRVAWNKFIVAVSWEAADDPQQTRWEGPIVLRGMSRSGQMHTMAGHGPFEQENCAKYGY